MATNSKIKTDIQKLDIESPKVELFILDATSLGGSTYYFTSMTMDSTASVEFGGITYQPLPVTILGLNKPGDGSMPRPKLQVANINLTFVAFVNAYNDGIGAKVSIIRTFKKYLDGQPGADSAAQFPPAAFYIEQKTMQNQKIIEWELTSPFDIGQRQLPKNQVLSYCQHRYRIYKDGDLDYTYATCPYTGAGYFTRGGLATTVDKDVCGKKLSDCELRYPLDTDQLPTKGFPLVGQLASVYR